MKTELLDSRATRAVPRTLLSGRILGHCAALTLLLLLVHVLISGAMPGKGAPGDDEALAFTLSKLVTSHGAIQYRDFGHDYMPLHFYFWGILMNLFGGDLLGLRIAEHLVDTVFAPILIFVIAIRITRSRLASLAAVAVYFAFSSVPLMKATVFLAALATLIYFKRHAEKSSLWIGFAIAVCGFTAQEFGVFITLTYVITLCYEHFCGCVAFRVLRQRVIWAAAGAAIVVVPFLLLYLVTGSLGAFFHHAVIKGFFSTPGAMNLPYPWGVDTSQPVNWVYYFYPLVLAAATYFFFFGPGVVHRSDAFAILVAFAASFTVATGRSDPGHIMMGLSVFSLVTIYLLVESLGQSPSVSSAAVRPLAVLAPVAVAAFQYWILAHNVTRYRWQIFLPILIGAAACAFLREKEMVGAPVQRRNISVFVAVILALTFFSHSLLAHVLVQARAVIQNTETLKTAFRLPKRAPTDIFGADFGEPQRSSILKIKAIIDKQTSPNDKILVFPQHAILYLVLNRANVADNYQFLLSIQPQEVASIIKKMEAARPPFVIYDKVLASSTGTGLNWYLLRHYKLFADTGWLQVLQRSAEPNREVALNQDIRDFAPDTTAPEYIYANYIKTGIADIAGGTYADALFQHPPYAERVTIQTPQVFENLKALRFEVLGNPLSAGDLGTAKALVREKGGRTYEEVFEKVFKNSQDRTATGVFTVPPTGIEALQLTSNLPHGTFWRITAVY